jgi:Protein of unknown function (DUF973)
VPNLLAHPGWLQNPSVLPGTEYAGIGLLVFGAVVGLVSFLLYLTGFRMMANSSSEFSSPAFLTLVGILGIGLAVGGLALYFSGVLLASSSYGLAPVAELFGAPLLVLGALLFLVGLFGQAAGGWRIGLRYQESVLRTGAILMIFPFVGYALSYIGYHRALTRDPRSAPLSMSS